jgi:hypothetical protein
MPNNRFNDLAELVEDGSLDIEIANDFARTVIDTLEEGQYIHRPGTHRNNNPPTEEIVSGAALASVQEAYNELYSTVLRNQAAFGVENVPPDPPTREPNVDLRVTVNTLKEMVRSYRSSVNR